MKIWLITIGEPIPLNGRRDRLLRTGMLANVLAESDHDVLWWTSGFDHSRKQQLVEHDTIIPLKRNLRVQLINGGGYRRNLSLQRIRDHRNIAGKMWKMMGECNPPDLIVAALPAIELSYVAARFGDIMSIPVVLDMRDMWPDIFIDAFWLPLRPIVRMAASQLFVQAAWACSRATAIIGITDAFVEWGLKRGKGRRRTSWDKAFPLGYSAALPSDSEIHEAELYWDEIGVDHNPRWNLCFIGNQGHQCDLETVLDAAREMQFRGLPWRFILCGDGEKGKRLRALASDLGNVVFPGWVDRSKIHVLLRRCVAGLDPIPNRYDFLATINNKAFEYLSAGLPIISSPPSGVLAELLAGEGCGVSYSCGDCRDLSRLLGGLNSSVIREMVANAERVFRERFAAERIYGDMALYFEALVGAYRSNTIKAAN